MRGHFRLRVFSSLANNQGLSFAQPALHGATPERPASDAKTPFPSDVDCVVVQLILARS